MNKIIIDNRSDLSDKDALRAVLDVVESGRISNDGRQYCYLTVRHYASGDSYQISTDLNKRSDRFVIVKEA